MYMLVLSTLKLHAIYHSGDSAALTGVWLLDGFFKFEMYAESKDGQFRPPRFAACFPCLFFADDFTTIRTENHQMPRHRCSGESDWARLLTASAHKNFEMYFPS